ncbi:MAG: hypothetical protein WC989_06635 [Micavibrio sp.]
MLRQSLCSAVVAAGFYSDAQASLPVNDTAPLAPSMTRMMQQIPPMPPPPPVPKTTAESCTASFALEFDLPFLTKMNEFFGSFETFLKERNRYSESFPEGYFGESELSGEDEDLYIYYSMIFDHGLYAAGTAEGLDYLLRQPDEINSIIRAYGAHALAQKYMMEQELFGSEVLGASMPADYAESYHAYEFFTLEYADKILKLNEVMNEALAHAQEESLQQCTAAPAGP